MMKLTLALLVVSLCYVAYVKVLVPVLRPNYLTIVILVFVKMLMVNVM